MWQKSEKKQAENKSTKSILNKRLKQRTLLALARSPVSSVTSALRYLTSMHIHCSLMFVLSSLNVIIIVVAVAAVLAPFSLVNFHYSCCAFCQCSCCWFAIILLLLSLFLLLVRQFMAALVSKYFACFRNVYCIFYDFEMFVSHRFSCDVSGFL